MQIITHPIRHTSQSLRNLSLFARGCSLQSRTLSCGVPCLKDYRKQRPHDLSSMHKKHLPSLLQDIKLQHQETNTPAPAAMPEVEPEILETSSIMHEPPTPKELCKHLDSYVIGQEGMKKKVAVALYNHYLRISHNAQLERNQKLGKSGAVPEAEVQLDKSNILLIGPSGSGKTLIAKTIAQILDVPFSMNDATPLTQSGYVGEDVEVIIYRLLQNANFDVKRAARGIVFLDEVDKIARRTDASNPNQRDVSGEGVQQGLLRILEGTQVTINVKPGVNKRGSGEQFVVDTTNILFVLSGAFVGLERIVRDRMSKKGSLGFGAMLKETEEQRKKADEEWSDSIEAEDLVRFGYIPEFVGRVPLLGVSRNLTEQQLVRILVEPRNAITRQYQEIFSRFGVQLSFSTGAFASIASEARARNVGARGLRRIMDNVLADAQYDLPGSEVKFCVVTSDVVAKKNPLHLFYAGDESLVHKLVTSDDSGLNFPAVPAAKPLRTGEEVMIPSKEVGGDGYKEAVAYVDPDIKC